MGTFLCKYINTLTQNKVTNKNVSTCRQELCAVTFAKNTEKGALGVHLKVSFLAYTPHTNAYNSSALNFCGAPSFHCCLTRNISK